MLLELALALSLLGGATTVQTGSTPPPADTATSGEQEVDPGGETDARAYIIDLG